MIDILSLFKALADSTRLRLLALLLDRELHVAEICDILDMGQSRISRHLKIMTDAGLLAARRDGMRVFYGLDRERHGEFAVQCVAPALRADPHLQHDAVRASQVLEQRGLASRRFFDAAADDWDRRVHAVLGGVSLPEEIARRVGAEDVVADLGCGAGAILAILTARARAVIGVDSAPRMLERARRRLQDAGERVSLRIGELEHLPLRDAEVDAAVSSLVLHHLLSPLRGMEEARRILRPGGRYLVAEFEKHDNESMRRDHADRWLGFTLPELRGWLCAAGFVVEEEARFPVNNGMHVMLFAARKPYHEQTGGNHAAPCETA